ncbi:MAG: electron transfer flavoprotein subunit beta/FixA family protein [Armatimonadetes bacterium]|nr:electron transfer flavoprotein subunit beta/FixA family protein [Armatimonadota bacterium]
MNIIVSIKQVPDTTEVRIDPVTNTLVREGVPSIINPFDENAIECGLQLVEKHGGKVTVITMGPPQAQQALKDALAMGADEAILVSDRAFAGSDTLATSYTLAQTIKKLGEYDLIICGKQAFDGDTAQVGPGLAEHLGIPQVTYAIDIEVEGKKARVKRLLSDRFEVVETRLPCLITVVKQMNEPRHASLKNVMKARKKEIPTWTAADIEADESRCGLNGSPTNVVKVFAPQRHTQGERLEGDVNDVVERLVKILREKQVV